MLKNGKLYNLTLDEAWRLCLEMWKEIKGRSDIPQAKAKWLNNNSFFDVRANCFFCEFNERMDRCRRCPAVLVDSDFKCERIEYDYLSNPEKFYMKLVELNELRKKKECPK